MYVFGNFLLCVLVQVHKQVSRSGGMSTDEIGFFFFQVSCLCGQSKSPYSGVFVCDGGFNVPTLLDETSFLFVQTIHYAVGAGRATPLAGVFITELKRALADSRRLMTGSGPERLRKP